MKKLLFFLFIITNIVVFSQDYANAIGLKFGWGLGIDAKHYMSLNSAVEANLDFQPSGFILSSNYEYHLPAFDEEGLYWFMGGGLYLGLWGEKNPWENIEEPMFVAGVSGIAGIEYNFQKNPFSMAIDLQPRFNLVNITRFWAIGGVAFRFTFQAKEEEEIIE
jgi:hypothetical protein